MPKFKITKTGIEGLVVIEPTLYGDNRGNFMETYNERDFAQIGLNMRFVQDNQSRSKQGVLRGLHCQVKNPQGKLVRVQRGEVFDVGVDVRQGSPTFGNWYGIVLSEENRKMIYLPEGFMHGFMVLSEEADFAYKCTDFYDPEDEDGVIWNDPTIGIKWPISEVREVLLSDRDKNLKSFILLKKV